jgi:hypothetical protein
MRTLTQWIISLMKKASPRQNNAAVFHQHPVQNRKRPFLSERHRKVFKRGRSPRIRIKAVRNSPRWCQIFKRGAKIELRTKSFAKLAKLPNSDGKLTLKIVADDFDRAKNAVEKLQKDMAEDASSLPSPHTPVSQLFEDENEEETKRLSDENR